MESKNFIKDGKAGELTYISIEKLHPHPNNPRKELGDLTELCDSIKVSGILQNLTVVPCTGYHYGEYTVVIGHRRMAAAKLAGLEELPCVIVEMSESEQIKTMLAENMQRRNLNIAEEANSMQLMLDLGDTIETIAEGVGMSESYVRRRLKMTELDPGRFKASVARGGTVMDYEKVYSISDKELQNKVLDAVGTDNFNWEYQKAVNTERQRDRANKALEILKTFAEPYKEGIKYKYINFFGSDIEVPQDAGEVKYYYEQDGTCFRLYREMTESDIVEDNTRNERAAKREQKRKEREEFTKRAFELRSDFVKTAYISGRRTDEVMRFAFASIIHNQGNYRRVTNEEFCTAAGLDTDDAGVINEIMSGKCDMTYAKALMLCAYCNYHDGEKNTYFNYDGSYRENKKLDEIYSFFEMMGYKMSDEERAFKDGTHELFETEE